MTKKSANAEGSLDRLVRRSSLWLDVEVCPGGHIESACQDAISLADQLGVTVWFIFNGVKCGARPGDDWQLLHENWLASLETKSLCKVACANPPNTQ